MAMRCAAAARSAARAAMTAAAPVASRTAGRELTISPLRRLVSTNGNLLAQEGKAAENIYIKKKEDEALKKMSETAQKNNQSQHEDAGTKADVPEMNIVQIMEVVEKNDFEYIELKYAYRVIQQKCGQYRHQIEMELSLERKSLEGVDELQHQYVKEVSKGTILQTQMDKKHQENAALRAKCATLEKTALQKTPFLDRLKHVVAGTITGKALDFILGGGGMFFRR